METWAHLLFVVSICTTYIFKPCFTEDSICPRVKSYVSGGRTLYYNETVCCDNFELKANQCVECDLGFYRPVDRTPEKCIHCDIGFYGKKCAFSCECHTNERCTANKGCVSNHKATDSEPNLSTTLNHADQSTKSTVMTSVTTTSLSDPMRLNETEDIEPTDTSMVNESTGFAGQWIIYTVIGCSVAVVIIMCLSFVFVFLKLNKRISRSHSIPLASRNPLHFATVPGELVEINMLDHDYEEIDEIDEINMVNATLHIDNTLNESDTDSNSISTISPTEDDEGYLHPYHSLVHLKKITRVVLDAQHSATDQQSNELLQNHYDQIQNKTQTISGLESMEIKDVSPTNSTKSGQEHAIENTVDPLCSLEDPDSLFCADLLHN